MVSAGEGLIILGIIGIILVVVLAVFDGNIWAYVTFGIIGVIALVIGIILELRGAFGKSSKKGETTTSDGKSIEEPEGTEMKDLSSTMSKASKALSDFSISSSK